MRWLVLFSCLLVSVAWAKPASITLTLASQQDNGHMYYHELLKEALAANGIELIIETPAEHIPQKRVVKMVQNNQLSLTWLIETKQRNRQFIPINVTLTNGLIGQRVLLIPDGAQELFDEIETLEQLKASGLVAGLGKEWFDVDVWRHNGLGAYLQDGEWRELYAKLSEDGEVNYFPRGFTEIYSEARIYSHLEIEKRLLLVYERDFKFYLSREAAMHKPMIQAALKKAKKTGLMDRLIKKYWYDSFIKLDPDNRTVIFLDLPD
ncbi:hypothetical protein J4N42_06735 [Vibrio sp. SCSIO 43135]|uniref:Solute-binding protein family 3/N-terminal domain-containing protein n=1 Tax=Vibrio paucivorans TaxID=2829489 RepID=A0A9X3CBB3_9VIBR|nr:MULTISPECIES: hypothetical protein [Vibrio]MCW8332526.1 hypothetical protein [Vibrio paucivorans]USD42406.1 hypothetical protein J4N42_06735 [Vibrio sp. SCSIO 43135]